MAQIRDGINWLAKKIAQNRLATLVLVIVVLSGLLVVIWAVWADSSPEWTGFGTYDAQTDGPRAKTLWDWMELLLVPVVLAIGAWWLNRSERAAERDIAEKRRLEDKAAAKQRADLEREITADNQRQAILEAYLDRMTDLLLDKGLRKSGKDDEVRSVARTRTLASLHGANLGGARLYEANLVRADMVAADLRGANLIGADLTKAVVTTDQLHMAKSCNEMTLPDGTIYKAGTDQSTGEGDKALTFPSDEPSDVTLQIDEEEE